MSDIQTRPDDTGERFAWGAQFVREDMDQRELHYHLLRLTAIGLRDEGIDRTVAAALGAVGGALARAFGAQLDETIARRGADAYLASLPGQAG
jgi:hypothetical protein